MNLTHYELAVAQMENKTATSLENMIDELKDDIPSIVSLEEPVGDLVLKVQCLLEGKKPTYGYYSKLDFESLKNNWPRIQAGIEWATETLSEFNIWDARRLPTAVPLRVLPALHQDIPKSGHARAQAMRLVRRYLWYSFLTDRYDRQANDRLKEDHDALVKVLKNEAKDICCSCIRT